MDIIIIITFKMLDGVAITNTKCDDIGNEKTIYYRGANINHSGEVL